MNPNTDIVISTRITREFPAENDFQNCIETLYTHTHNFRPILVDDNSDEIGRRVIEQVADRFNGSILVRTHFQRWFTRAFNIGLRMVKTPYAVILNCDTILDTGWLEELYAVKDEVEATVGKVGLVGSVLSEAEPRRYYINQHPGFVTGHCLLLNMEAVNAVTSARGTPGWVLDETQAIMIHIRSDIEISYRLMELGWQCVHAFKSRVGHPGAKCWGQQLGRIPPILDVVNERYIP